jgi:phosphatidylglycerol---prolipoprotein diacylglyceryl transferase
MEPLVVSLGPLTLQAWGLFMLLALGTGATLFWWGVVHYRLNPEKAMWLFLGALGGGVLGGKLSMIVFLGPQAFFSNLPELARTGMAYTGSLFGGYLGVRLMEHYSGMSCRCDLFVLPIPLMQAIGRLGNFFAVDAYGTSTDLPWGVNQAGALRHPVQLYEAALDLALFALLLRVRGRFPYRDHLFRVYIVGYALIRFPLEYLRYQPTPRELIGLTLVQHLCVLGIASVGIWLVWFLSRDWRTARFAQSRVAWPASR